MKTIISSLFVLFFGLLLLFQAAYPASAVVPVVPNGFRDEVVAGGNNIPTQHQLNLPTALAFLPDGRMLVTEKGGKLRLIADNLVQAVPVIDLTAGISSSGDGGLIGVAVDPEFTTNGAIYLLYTSNNPREGRLSRFTMNGNTASITSETILLRTIADNVSHMVNSVHFGPDNTLYVSVGDSSAYDQATIQSTRAQEKNVPLGKIFRITREGKGIPSNPFWTGNPDDVASKIFALGLRNPFRLTVRPDGSVIVGDVGWNNWEEVNHIPASGGNRNFGWPCYEGGVNGSQTQTAFGNFPICQSLLPQGTGAVTAPSFAYNHTVGSSITGGPVYDGTVFPAPYKGSYFFGDYKGNWINYWPMDSIGNFVGQPIRFGTITSPVDIKLGSDGALYYISIIDAQVRRITYGSPASCSVGNYTANYYTNATWSGTPTISRCEDTINNDWGKGGPFGTSPVDNYSISWTGDQYFSAGSSTLSATSDDSMQVWVDGNLVIDNSGIHPATTKTATITYPTSGFHDVVIKYNEIGGSASAKFSVSNINKPPVPVISTPVNGSSFGASQIISVSGAATDPEEGNLPDGSLQWNTILHHCPPPAAPGVTDICHTHPYSSFTGKNGTVTAPDTAGDWNWLEIRLTAIDSIGATTTNSVNIYPNTCAVGRYQARYFTNKTWSGTPAISRCDNSITNDWSKGGPFGTSPVDNYSIDWQGAQLFQAGTSTLSVTSDDGTQVWLDGKLVINNDAIQPATTKTASVTYSTAGYHDVLIRYYEAGGYASAKFSITNTNATSCTNGKYLAKYYKNTSWSAAPAISRCEDSINYNWSKGGPFGASPVDNYSINWTGNQYFAAGANTVSVTSDDGTQVLVDGKLVIDNGGIHAARTKTATLTYPSAGFHTVVIKYNEIAGYASAKFSITQ